MRLLALLTIVGVAATITHQTAMALEQNTKGKYTIVAPGTLHSARPYNVAVAVHDTEEPVTINIGIVGPELKLEKTVELANQDEVENIAFELPELTEGKYNLTAEGVKGLIFKNTTELVMEKFKAHVIIQTDKGKYKPGDLINYRVIFLNEHLKPGLLESDVVIWLEDPKRNRLKEIKAFNTTSGVYTDAIELSEYALLGNWRLGVSYGKQYVQDVYFEVEKYVLPKYEIKVEATENIAVQDGDMQVIVRANYTYGKPVDGKVTIVITLRTWGRYYHPMVRRIANDGVEEESQPEPPVIIRTADMVNGKAKIDLNVKEYEAFMPNKLSASTLEIVATVEEQFTGVKLNGTRSSTLYPYRYHMNCISFDTCYSFHAGKDAEVSFKLEYIDGTQLNDTKSIVKLTYTETIERINYWRKDKAESVETPKIDKKVLTFESHMNESGVVTFKVNLPDLEDYEHFNHYYKQSLEYASEKRDIYNTFPYREPKVLPDTPAYEEPKEYFRLEVKYEKDKYHYNIGDMAKVNINSSEPLDYFVYTIVARGNVHKSAKVKLEGQKTYDMQFPITFDMTPNCKVYVYYIDQKNELHAAETSMYNKVELQNKIEIEAPTEVKPGDVVPLTIKTAPDSFVGLMAIDQSVLLLGENNDLQEHQFGWRLGSYDTRTPPQEVYRRLPGDYTGVVTLTNADWKEPERLFMLHKAHANRLGVSAVSAFGSGQAAMAPESAQFDSVGGTARGDVVETRIRKNFAETWIFDNIERTEDAITKWTKQVPDTITSWLISGFSLNNEKGIGVTNERFKLKTFQPFFISVRLPYSVKRDEVIRVPALVFNYLEKDLDVKLTLDNTDGEYEFVEPDNDVAAEKQRTKMVRVPSHSARGVDFLLRPKMVGNIMLKFTAVSPIAGDAIHKTLKVVPEGITKYANRAYFVNLQKDVGEFKESFELVLPEKIVPDSEHIEFAIVGDLLGPLLNNLENLVRLPMGCGEQTMSQYVLNMIVLQYLQSYGQETKTMEHQIKRHLSVGYQKLLSYLHDDGSFSSFGPGTYKIDDKEVERNGSTWLTAYVMRSLSQGNKYAQVDDKIFENGYKYLASRQADNGSFTEQGEYFYGAQKSGIVLTAKVVLAFLANETHAAPYKEQLDKALKYLTEEATKAEKIYERALAAYTLEQAKNKAYLTELEKLQGEAKTEDDRKWWTEKKVQRPRGCCWWIWAYSNDVEITSYILLTMLEQESITTDEVLPIIRWLVAQRNNYGGFTSTQDTVVGLEALAKFAKKANYQPAAMTFDISSVGATAKQAKLEAHQDNALVMQSVEFPAETKKIDFSAKGTGAALVQIAYQYNVLEKEIEPSFKVEADIKPETGNLLLLNVCVEFVGSEDNSNMAVLEISLPSGYTADTERFEEIEKVERVRLVETKNLETMIVVYFESLHKGKQLCMEVGAYKSHDVSQQKPASIVLYDYYDTTRKGSTFYDLNKAEA